MHGKCTLLVIIYYIDMKSNHGNQRKPHPQLTSNVKAEHSGDSINHHRLENMILPCLHRV